MLEQSMEIGRPHDDLTLSRAHARRLMHACLWDDGEDGWG